MTSSMCIVTAASRSFEASQRQCVQKISNEIKTLSSNGNGQWVSGALLRRWDGETSWGSLID